MKRIVLLSFLLLILISLSQTPVYALQSSIIWNSNKYFQGDSGTVTVTLYNNVNLVEWYIGTVYMQFDWQVQSNYRWNGSPTDQYIASGQSLSFNIPFQVPSGISVGDHSYTIYYIGLYGDVNQVATGSFYVHDMYEKQYDGLLPSVQSQLNSATNYNSPQARSDISQAESYYVQATTLASQGQFQSAVNELNNAQSMISQASSAEQSYNANNYNSGGGSSSNYNPNSYRSSFDLGTLILIIVLPVAIGGGIAFWMGKKKIETRSQRSNKDRISAPKVEEERRDAMHLVSTEEVKVENVTKEIPKIETKPTKSIEEKIKKERKPKKSKKEIEQDQNALEILKERLARGTITKPEYDELKKEFE